MNYCTEPSWKFIALYLDHQNNGVTDGANVSAPTRTRTSAATLPLFISCIYYHRIPCLVMISCLCQICFILIGLSSWWPFKHNIRFFNISWIYLLKPSYDFFHIWNAYSHKAQNNTLWILHLNKINVYTIFEMEMSPCGRLSPLAAPQIVKM